MIEKQDLDKVTPAAYRAILYCATSVIGAQAQYTAWAGPSLPYIDRDRRDFKCTDGRYSLFYSSTGHLDVPCSRPSSDGGSTAADTRGCSK